METKPNVSYTGVVLDDESRHRLLLWVGLTQPTWVTYCHHMTVNMGPFKADLNPEAKLGQKYTLKATHFASSDKVVAVKVVCPDLKTVNKTPHITVVVNVDNGGKPKHSNDLPDDRWLELCEEIDLIGTLEEVSNSKVTK